MAFKPVSQKGFVKGVVAVMDRFSVPKGAVLMASNLLMAERGSLTTCDGTSFQSNLASAPGTNGIVELGMFVSSSFALTKLAGIPVDATHLRMYSWIGDSNPNDALVALTGPGTDLALTSDWVQPQFVNFAGATIITLGNDVTPQFTADGATFAPITANTTGNWQANHYYNIGDRVAAFGNAYQVSQLTVSSSNTSTGAGGVGNGGFSGSATPNFQNSDIAGTAVHDNQVIWICIGQNAAATARQSLPAGAAHAISHAGALWLWNTSPTNTDPSTNNGGGDGPSVLRQSGVSDYGAWPNLNIAFIGKDDGTQGTGIGSFTIAEAGIAPTGSLVLFKDYTTYQVTGVFGASNFAITQVKTDMGCVAARTVQFATGFGLIRFTHLGFGMFDGVNDRLISEEVRPYIFGRADIVGVDFDSLQFAHATLTTSPPMYVCVLPTLDGNRTRIFCYDLIMRAWAIVDYFNGSMKQPLTIIKQLRPPVVAAQPQSAHTYVADLFNGTATIRQWQQGDLSWDGIPIGYSVQMPEVGDPGSRAYFRRSIVRMHAPSPGKMAARFALASVQAPNQANSSAATGPSSGNPINLETAANYNGDSDLGVSFDIGQSAPSMNVTLSGSGKVYIEGVDYHLVPKAPRPFGGTF